MPSSTSLSNSSSSYATSWTSSSSWSSSRSSFSSSSTEQTSKTSRLTEIQEELKEIIELQKLRLQATEQEITKKQFTHSDKLNTSEQTELQESKETLVKYASDDEHHHRKQTLEFKDNKKSQSEKSEENASQVRITIEKEPSCVTSHSSTSQKMKTSMSSMNLETEQNVEPNRHSLYDYDKAKLPASDAMKHDVISTNEWLSSHSEYSPIAIPMQFKDGLEKDYHRYNSIINANGRTSQPYTYFDYNGHHNINRYSQQEPHNIHQWEDKQRRTHLEWRQKEEHEKKLQLRQEELYKLELETRLINRHKGVLTVASMSTSQLQKSIDYLWLSRSEKMKHKLKRKVLLQKVRKQPTILKAEQENEVEPAAAAAVEAMNAKKQHKHNKDDDNKENENGKMKINNKTDMYDEQGLDMSALHNVAAMTLNKPLKAANANIFSYNNNHKFGKGDNTKGKAVIDTSAGELYYYYNKGFRLLQYVEVLSDYTFHTH